VALATKIILPVAASPTFAVLVHVTASQFLHVPFYQPSTMAFPHHRHQSSLEGVIDLSSPQPLEPDQRDRATRIFNQIVAHFEPSQTEDKGYKRVTLIRAVHEYTINRDNFLHCFFLHVEKELRPSDDASELSLSQALSRFDYPDSWNDEQRNELSARLAAFADYLVDNFFLPRKASRMCANKKY
jgi:hypothetical protein